MSHRQRPRTWLAKTSARPRVYLETAGCPALPVLHALFDAHRYPNGVDRPGRECSETTVDSGFRSTEVGDHLGSLFSSHSLYNQCMLVRFRKHLTSLANATTLAQSVISSQGLGRGADKSTDPHHESEPSQWSALIPLHPTLVLSKARTNAVKRPCLPASTPKVRSTFDTSFRSSPRSPALSNPCFTVPALAPAPLFRSPASLIVAY